MFESLLNAFRAPDIRRRILFVLGILIVFRALAHVPVPGADPKALPDFFADNALFGLLDLFSGGGLSRFSVVGLGVNPYINASIIMQLMTGVVPALQALQREGEYGRNKINQYTRYLSVPLAVLQSYGFLALLNSPGVLTTDFDLVVVRHDHPDRHPDGRLGRSSCGSASSSPRRGSATASASSSSPASWRGCRAGSCASSSRPTGSRRSCSWRSPSSPWP